MTGQLQEMEMIRQKVYQLEQAQFKFNNFFFAFFFFFFFFLMNAEAAANAIPVTKPKFDFCGMS